MDPWDSYIIPLTPPLILETRLTRASLPTKLERQGYSFLILRLPHYPDDLLINTGGPHPPFSAKWMRIAMHSCSGRGGGQGVSPVPQAPRGRFPWVVFFIMGTGPASGMGRRRQQVLRSCSLHSGASTTRVRKIAAVPQPLTFPILCLLRWVLPSCQQIARSKPKVRGSAHACCTANRKMCLGLPLSVLICQFLISSSAMTKYADQL